MKITVTNFHDEEQMTHTADTFTDLVRDVLVHAEASESTDWVMWIMLPALAHFAEKIYEGECEAECVHHDMSDDDLKITFTMEDE